VARLPERVSECRRPDAVLIHHRERRQVVDSAADILYTLGGILGVSRVSFTLALVTGIKRQRYVPLLGHSAGVDTGSLLFDSTKWMNHNQRRVLVSVLRHRWSEQSAAHARELIWNLDLRRLDGWLCAHNILLYGFRVLRMR